MKLGEKIILLRPRSVNLGVFLHDNGESIIHANLTFTGFLNGHQINPKSFTNYRFLDKKSWSQVMSEEEFDNIWNLLITKEKTNVELAKTIFEGAFLEKLKEL